MIVSTRIATTVRLQSPDRRSVHSQTSAEAMLHRLAFAPFLSALGITCAVLASTSPAAAQHGQIFSDVPVQINPAAGYLIYLHGRIIEEEGRRPTDERFGTYEYQLILDTLAASGAEVISQQRPQGTNFKEFGARVADQVRRLLRAGVPAERIAVVGFSKGGAIAIIASALLGDPRITYVFLGACGDWVNGRDDVDVRGRILSVYEASDELGTSCEPLFTQATAPGEYRELRLDTGAGHGTFFRPRSEWLSPLMKWVGSRSEAAIGAWPGLRGTEARAPS